MSLFNVNQTVASKARNTSDVPFKEKQFLIVTDSGDIFYDFDGTRVQLTDILVVDTESQRLALTCSCRNPYLAADFLHAFSPVVHCFS